MSLIKCSECGKEISNKATTCPNCGCPVQQAITSEPVVQSPPPKKKGHGCLVSVVILFLVFAGLGVAVSQGVKDMEENPEKYDNSITAKYIDISSEDGKNIDNILKECGIETLSAFEHDKLLDNAHSEGETGYRLSISDSVDNIILYLDSDKNVYSISYNTYDLYADGKAVAKIQDYTFTTNEISNLMIQCEEKVKEILKSPSTAKFPNMLDWGFSKERNIVKVSGYVDSQNSFGAEMRSEFWFTIDTDTDTIQSFIFDGQELIQ